MISVPEKVHLFLVNVKVWHDLSCVLRRAGGTAPRCRQEGHDWAEFAERVCPAAALLNATESIQRLVRFCGVKKTVTAIEFSSSEGKF